MQAKDFWGVIHGHLVDVVSIHIDLAICWAVIEARRSIFVSILQASCLTELLKDSHKASSILIISDSSSVVDMTCDEQ